MRLFTCLVAIVFAGPLMAQELPNITVEPPKSGTDWVQLAVTIGGFLVTLLGMWITYLKSSKAEATAARTEKKQDDAVVQREELKQEVQTVKEKVDEVKDLNHKQFMTVMSVGQAQKQPPPASGG